MLKGLRNTSFIILALLLLPSRSFSQDLGMPDTCRVEEIGTVQPNSHFFLEITAFNDEALGGFAIPLSYGVPPMDIVCDSFSFSGTRTVNPGLYGLEVDTSNYSLMLYAIWYSGDLSPGDGPIATLYFSTGPNWDSTQGFVVDTMIWPPAQGLEFVNATTGYGFAPVFERGSVGPYLVVISPRGGETWLAGEIHKIKWISNLNESENVKIEYSADHGGSWFTVVDSTSNDGSFFWTIPSLYSTNCLIKISEVTDGKPWGRSFSDFTILLFTMFAYPQLTMVDVGGAADYRVKVNSVGYSSPVTLSLSGLPPNSNYSFSLNPIIPSDSSILTVNTASNTPAGIYLMSLLAQGNGQIIDSQLTLVVNQAPAPFNLSYPGNGDTVTAIYPKVGWEKANDPDPYDTVTYIVYYSSDGNFTLQDSIRTSSISVSLPLRADSTLTFWKVKAVDKWSEFTWCTQSFWSFFAVNRAPEPFNLSYPVNGDTLESFNPKVTWQKANDPDPYDQITYTIYYSTDSSFVSQDSTKCTSTSVFLPGWVDSTLCFWKVKAVDAQGKFAWCNQPFWHFFWIWAPRTGDVNGDGNTNVGDVIYLINYLFKFGTVPITMHSGDTNCDGKIQLGDVVYLISYLFKGGPPPC